MKKKKAFQTIRIGRSTRAGMNGTWVPLNMDKLAPYLFQEPVVQLYVYIA